MRIAGVLGSLAILLCGVSFGQTYVPLKAKFTNGEGYQLLNDREPVPGEYAYVDSAKGAKSNPYVAFEPRYGQLRLYLSNSGVTARFVQVLIFPDQAVEDPPIYLPRSSCYPSRFPDVMAIRMNRIYTMSEDVLKDGTWTQTGKALNVRDMQGGEVKYCFLACLFEVMNDRS